MQRMRPRILITGGSGFLGGHLLASAGARWKTYSSSHTSRVWCPADCAVVELDIVDEAEVMGTIRAIAPHVVIHAAALANWGLCARDPEAAWRTNVRGTQNVTQAAQAVGARLIFLSTDLVHDGRRGYYGEQDPAHPIGVYGRTKLEAESIVSSLCANYCIVRMSLAYGITCNESRCLLEKTAEALRQGKAVHLFRDEYRSPIYVENAAEILMEIALRDELQGLFNLCGPDRLSRLDLGLKLAEVFGLDRGLIIPSDSDQFPGKDKRPKDCSLNNAKAAGVLQTKFLTVDAGLERMREQYRWHGPADQGSNLT